MRCKVLLTQAAKNDLDRTFSEVYKACLDEKKTRKYINELIDAIEKKADFPESGVPFYFGSLFTGYRYVMYKSYIAFYRINVDTIIVDRILFSRSNYCEALLAQSN